MQSMGLLVKQLPTLPGEKTVAAKTKEVAVRTGAMAMESLFGRMAPSQKQLRSQYRTPQAEVFYGLMDHLAESRKANRSTNTRVFGFKKPTPRSGPATFYAPEIDRRRLNAPVWKELILHAYELKDGRQEKMLAGLKANFEDLPVGGSPLEITKMTEMIDAYSESFVNLARMLARPSPESAPETLSKQETMALGILGEYAVRLSWPARQQLRDELTSACNATHVLRPALSDALTNLNTTLANAPANNSNQVDAVSGGATQNTPEDGRPLTRKALTDRISRSVGSVSDTVKAMIELADRLPKLSNAIQSASQPSLRTETFEFLLQHLDTPRNPQEVNPSLRKLWTIPKRELKFDGQDVARRTSAAPVWTALFSKVNALGPMQQGRLLNRFAENFEVFNQLPREQAEDWAPEKQQLLAAYAPSVVELARVFFNLDNSADVMSPVQVDAIRILREYGEQLSTEAQSVLSDTIRGVLDNPQNSAYLNHPGMYALNSFQNELARNPHPV